MKDLSPQASVSHSPTSRLLRMLLSLLAGAIGGTITGLLVSHIITRHAHSDYRAHAKMASLAVDPGAIYGHFLYFVTVARAAGWSADIHRILDATPFVLGAAIGIAIVVAQQLVRSLAGITGTRSGALPEVGIALTVVALFFSFSLPTTTNYIGQFPPMVWHNSTVLFLMPFAIGLYFATLKMLERPTRWLVGLVMLLVALNVAAKPSFVLAWIPAVPLFAVVNRLNRRAIVTSIVTSLYALALIGVQSHYIFHSAASARLYKIMDIQVTGVKIVPFYVWNVYSDNQLFSLLASNVLTLTAVAVYRRKLLSWQQFQLAACLYVVGLAIWILFSMQGSAAFAADFLWQMVPCTMLMFLTVVAYFWKELLLRGRLRATDGAVVIALVVQVAAFVRYIDIYLTTGAYR